MHRVHLQFSSKSPISFRVSRSFSSPCPAVIRARVSIITRVPRLPGVHLAQQYFSWTRFIYSAAMVTMSTSLSRTINPSQPMKAPMLPSSRYFAGSLKAAASGSPPCRLSTTLPPQLEKTISAKLNLPFRSAFRHKDHSKKAPQRLIVAVRVLMFH